MNITKKILFSILILIILLICYYYYSKTYSIEKYQNIHNADANNIIINGNFDNGNNPQQYISKSGQNDIVPYNNPSNSSYCLKQTQTGTQTFYEMKILNIMSNNNYIFYIWTSLDNNPPDYAQLVKIRIPTKSNSNYNPGMNIQLVNKLYTNSSVTWYLVSYEFNSSDNIIGEMYIKLSDTDKLQSKYIYFSDLRLYHVLNDAKNYLYTNGLNLYLDGYHYTVGTIWKDITYQGNDFKFDKQPLTVPGGVSILNNRLSMDNAQHIFSSQSFTFVFCIQNKDNANMPPPMTILQISGNDKYSIVLKMGNYMSNIQLITPNVTINSSREIVYYNKSVFFLTYDINTNIISLYQDSALIMSTPTTKLYINGIIEFNPLLTEWNTSIFSILNYNRILAQEEMIAIKDYFITNKNQNSNVSDSDLFLMYNPPVNSTNNPPLPVPAPIPVPVPIPVPEKCLEDCNHECGDNYDCVQNCKITMPSCVDYCTNNPESNVCIQCPSAYKKEDNKYYVYIQPNSYYANIYKYSGERCYGPDRERAAEMYSINFNRCLLPPILQPGEGVTYIDKCPWNIYKNNPCYNDECVGVNWETHENIPPKCKNSISYYCMNNYELDPQCDCWSPEMQNNPECIEKRRFIEDPYQYCPISLYKIEDHPDFSKYIKKDKIPCWGCKID